MAEALQQLHDAGYIHRDLRLDNWMRDAGGRIILGDLGAAAAVGSVPLAQLPFGYSHGPLGVLQALQDKSELPVATVEQDWEQFSRVVIATLAGVTVVHVPGEYGQMMDGWMAVDAALPTAYQRLLLLAGDSGRRTVALIQEAIFALPFL